MQIFSYDFVVDLLALHRINPTRYPFLLGSESISELSRFSLLFAYPGEKILSDGHFSTSFEQAFQANQPSRDHSQQALPASKLSVNDKTAPTQDLPFRGGWFVYLGYEFAQELEPTLDLSPDVFDLPAAIAVRIPCAVIIDHLQQITYVMAESVEYQAEFDQIVADINGMASSQASHDASVVNEGDDASTVAKPEQIVLQSLIEDEPLRYLDGVERIAEYIKAGDVFQVNLSRAWQGELPPEISIADIYQVLAAKNPAPFAALVDFGDFSIASSSPERLVRVKDGWVETRPIAGTRPRSNDDEKDRELMAELINHPKEQAEHIMLLDLERNDVGRVSKPGTVEVNEMMIIETYRHVHHIVSNVRGRIRDDVTLGELFWAVFPGGTITGCPKVRCMEIVSELEQVGRGAYTGSLGYINHNGEMDLNILIRTLVKQGDNINFRTGAGIVYDSIPEKEVEETRHKAKGLLRVFNDLG